VIRDRILLRLVPIAASALVAAWLGAAPVEAHKRAVLAVAPVDLGLLAEPLTDAFGQLSHDTSASGPCHRVWQCNGIDLFAARGTPIRAPFDGLVTTGRNRLGGRSFTITSSDGTTQAYGAHMKSFALFATRPVRAGDALGYVGASGNASGGLPHLHLAVARLTRRGWVGVNPFPLLLRVAQG
jgi:murein DD-endopeptidase MepM/ murein hydrolase activator NlpD